MVLINLTFYLLLGKLQLFSPPQDLFVITIDWLAQGTLLPQSMLTNALGAT